MGKLRRIIVTSDASGARDAARAGMLVIIVDIIDMSTTLESALDAGAYAVLGASPDFTRAPVQVEPYKMGEYASKLAKEAGSNIIIVSEPRIGTDEERINRSTKVMRGIEDSGGIIERVIPNIGAESYKLADFKNKVVIAITDTGGVAYDAAFVENQQVTTATVARTYKQRGLEPALTGVKRAYKMLQAGDTGIAIVAASQNSLEDVLAAQYIYNLFLMQKHINP
ncbi:MAG TPA: hypothetical protein VFD02_02045 [Syntrophomonadaceae bacterium]|nr:hypothetical protein [Syntrophomonadaceae bacterium]